MDQQTKQQPMKQVNVTLIASVFHISDWEYAVSLSDESPETLARLLERCPISEINSETAKLIRSMLEDVAFAID